MAEKRKYSDLAELLEAADLSDNSVFRYWIVMLMLEIHGDLDSISYCARSALNVGSWLGKLGGKGPGVEKPAAPSSPQTELPPVRNAGGPRGRR